VPPSWLSQRLNDAPLGLRHLVGAERGQTLSAGTATKTLCQGHLKKLSEILDEATAAVEERGAIQRSLERITAERTTLGECHREHRTTQIALWCWEARPDQSRAA